MTAAAAGDRRKMSLETLQESRSARTILGVVLAAVLIAIVGLIVSAFSGKFTDIESVQGQLPGTGNALPGGSLVLYKNVTIGKIGHETQGPNNTIAVTFQLYPGKAKSVPKNVVALVTPLSIFGNQSVNLVVPNGATPAAESIAAGDFVPADTQISSSSLQDTTTQIYNLLHAVSPTDLDKALTAFATALNGEGKNLGQALAATDQYLKSTINPNLRQLNDDTRLLSPVAANLNTAAPNVLGTLSNSVPTSKVIAANGNGPNSNLHSLLANGDGTTQQLTTFFNGVQTTLPNLLNASGPVLQDFSRNPLFLRQTLNGLAAFSTAVSAAESHGPFLSVSATLPIFNTTAAVEAALGNSTPAQLQAQLTQALGASFFNPPTYTSADCPIYGGETNYCGSGGSAASGNAHTNTGASAAARANQASAASVQSPVNVDANAAINNPYGTEVDAMQGMASALNGGRPAAVPGLSSLVLVPLFNSMATGS